MMPLQADGGSDRVQDGDEDAAARAVDTQAGPEQRLLRDERALRLQAAVQALPARQRECLRLRAKGMRYREIAAVLQVSVTTVAEVVHQGLARRGKDVQ